MAATVYRLGDSPGVGSSVKLVNQHLAGVHIAAAAEAMALGMRMGIDADTLYEVITHSAGNSWMFENRVPHIIKGDYTPLSAVDIFVKDLNIVHQTGRELALAMPVAASALQQFTAASGMGLGREDDSAVIKVYQRLSGIELPKGKVAQGEEVNQ
jgi:3-hydroxyisobutyrate dehydrogenase